MTYCQTEKLRTFAISQASRIAKITSLVILAIFLVSCSKNLDVKCSELFEDVSEVLDAALSLEVQQNQELLAAQLDVFQDDIDELKKGIDKFYKKKRPRDTFRDDPNAPFFRDDLQVRKVRALNSYLSRSNDLGLAGDGFGFGKDSATKLRQLSMDCNGLLR